MTTIIYPKCVTEFVAISYFQLSLPKYLGNAYWSLKYQDSLVRAFDYQLELPKLPKTQTHPTLVSNNAVKSVC